MGSSRRCCCWWCSVFSWDQAHAHYHRLGKSLWQWHWILVELLARRMSSAHTLFFLDGEMALGDVLGRPSESWDRELDILSQHSHKDSTAQPYRKWLWSCERLSSCSPTGRSVEDYDEGGLWSLGATTVMGVVFLWENSLRLSEFSGFRVENDGMTPFFLPRLSDRILCFLERFPQNNFAPLYVTSSILRSG